MNEQPLALDDRVQVKDAWPRNAKGKIRVLIGGSRPLVRVDFDQTHRIEGYPYTYNWYRPEQIQRIVPSVPQEGSVVCSNQ